MCGVLRVLCCVASGAGACSGLKEAGFEPMLLIAYAFLQAAVVATLLKFSTRAVARGSLVATSLPNQGLAIFAGGRRDAFSL